MKKLIFNLFYLCLTSILITSCSDDESVNNPSITWTDNSSTYNVVYNDNTIVIEKSELGDLVSVDEEKHTYTFNSTNEKIKNLQVGDILIIYGKALRKVSEIKIQNEIIVIETEYATLNEAIKSGKIEWDYGCDFTSAAKPVIVLAGKEYDAKLMGDILHWNITFDGLKYLIEMTLNGDNAKVKFQIEKNLGGNAGANFIAEGTIQRFRSRNSLNFDNSQLTDFTNSNDGLVGNLQLSLVVAASANDNVNLELPIVLLKYPFMVGPVPCLINVKAQVVVNAVVPMGASSQVTAQFNYSSNTGFKYSGSNFEAKGNIGNYTINKIKTETGSPSVISANFGIGFPRLELSMLGEVVVPWIQTACLIGGDYTFNPACQEAKAQFIGACGVDLSFLGIEKSFSKTLWQEEKVLFKSGACQ